MNLFNHFRKKVSSNEVEKYYEEWTARYVESFGQIFQSKMAESPEKLANYYIEQMGLRENMKILDAGCGIGGPAIEICKQINVLIDGITLSQTQIDLATENIKKAELNDNIQVYKIDFHNMQSSFKENSYDVIYFFESLVHSSEPKKVLEQAYRLLKPDGILYIKDLFEKTAYNKEDKEKIGFWVSHNNKAIKMNITKKEDLLIDLRNIGFQLEFCQLMRIPTNQDNGNSFVVVNNIMPEMAQNIVTPYLEWYEVKSIKPGHRILEKL